MIPASLGAVLLLLALLPGYLFLRITSDRRPPAQHTALTELLEVAGIGSITTGVVVLGHAVSAPQAFAPVAAFAFSDAAAVKGVALLLLSNVAFATALAVLLGWAHRFIFGRREFVDELWQGVFSSEKPGYARHVAVEFADGRTMDGRLRGYTVSPGADGSRQLALGAPVRSEMPSTEPGSESISTFLSWDAVVIDASDVVFIALQYVPTTPDGTTPDGTTPDGTT